MKKRWQKLMAFVLTLALAITFVPQMNVKAADPGGGLTPGGTPGGGMMPGSDPGGGQDVVDTYELVFNVQQGTTHQVSIRDNGTELVIDNMYLMARDGNRENAAVSVTENNGVWVMKVPKGKACVLDYGGNAFTLFANGKPVQANVTQFDQNMNIQIQDYDNSQQGDGQQGGGDNPPRGDTSAVVTLSAYTPGGAWTGEPMCSLPGISSDKPDELARAEYDKSYGLVGVGVNSGRNVGWMTQRINDYGENYQNNQNIQYSKSKDGQKTTIVLFHNWSYRIEKLRIDGTDYSNQLGFYKQRYDWMKHFGNQGIFVEVEVDPAILNDNKLNVELDVRPITLDECFIGNFLWSNDEYFSPTGEEPNDCYIGHSKLTLLSVEYNDGDPNWDWDKGWKSVDVSKYGDKYDDPDVPYVHYVLDSPGTAASRVPVPTSEMVIPEGARVTMRIEPEYGYQVLSFSGVRRDHGNVELGGQSEFTFIVGKGNFHIGAHVEKVEDEVKTESKNVKDGDVKLAEGTLDFGSARLEVSDAEVSAAKEAQFETKAEESGFTVSDTVLNLDLNQVFYKGGVQAEGESDVWATPMNDLEQPATISLVVDPATVPAGADVAIVHDVHDSGNMEVIKPDSYNAQTGELVFKAPGFSNFAIATSAVDTPDVPAVTPDVSVSYRTHVQTKGWLDPVANGAVSGTTGESKRLEGIEISVSGNKNLGIQYTTHCQTYGWMPWSAQGEMSGTTGESKRLEAIMIRLTGADKDKYDVYYRVHAQSFGWLNWAKNGAPAGTAGLSKRLEAIQVVVVKKDEAIPASALEIQSVQDKAYISASGAQPVIGQADTSADAPAVGDADDTVVMYKTHVQTYGWQGWKANGGLAGTVGESKRLEAIDIKLSNKMYTGGIQYVTHVQTYGWQAAENNPATWARDGEASGTSGQSKRLEAIRISLYGDMAEHYDVYYRVHAQTYGWLSWTKNGEAAGTAGLSKRLEGIQIVLVPKGADAPAANYQGVTSVVNQPFISK